MDRKILTFPSEVHKNGCDNIEGNLIVHKGDIINQKNAKYKVISFLGKGSYGQVFKCVNLTNNELVALKISKGELIYTKQSFKESNVLHKLNPLCEDLIVKIYHDFDYKGHHCLVLELLSLNLYDYLKSNNFEGIEHRHLRKIAKQCLKCLSVIHSNQIIHSDIKPENILISSNDLDVKIIDLGACFYVNQPIREDFYIQSRYYRSPEVLKREHISTSIDVWSLGCVLYELFMGKPLFQGSDNFDQLKRISYFFGNNMLKTRLEIFNILPNYPRKQSFCQENNNQLINSTSILPEQNEKIYYETCEEYKYGDKTIKNKRKSSFVENVKRNYLRKEDCIKLIHFKGEKKDNDDFLDLLFLMIQPYYLLRPSAIELLNHKYLVDDYVAGGMVTNLGEQVDIDNNRLINPSPSKIDNKTFSSGFSFNDPENKARRFTSHIRKNTKK